MKIDFDITFIDFKSVKQFIRCFTTTYVPNISTEGNGRHRYLKHIELSLQMNICRVFEIKYTYFEKLKKEQKLIRSKNDVLIRVSFDCTIN